MRGSVVIRRVAEALDPSPFVARSGGPTPAGTLISVYRERNAEVVARLADEAGAMGWEVRLWALDEVAPALAPVTVGSGPGGRFALVNRIAEGRPDGWLVVADDDVVFQRGGLREAVALAARLGLDVAQPAHAAASNVSHTFTRRRPGAVARRTGFVEIGPLFILSPAAQAEVLPFGETGMGWLVQVDWLDLAGKGLHLGILDAVPVLHLGPVGAQYDAEDERQQMDAALADRGLTGLASAQVTSATIRAWSLPPVPGR